MTSDPDLRRAVATISERLAEGDAGPLLDWFARHGAERPLVLWEPDPERIEAPQLRFLLAHWTALRGARAMPARAEISPLELRPALGFVCLIDALDDGFDFHYRLYGTTAAQRLGLDMTGRSVWTFPTAPWLQAYHAAVYRAVLLRGLPLYTRHKPAERSRVIEAQRIALPLADEPGAPHRLLAGIVPAERRYEPAKGGADPPAAGDKRSRRA